MLSNSLVLLSIRTRQGDVQINSSMLIKTKICSLTHISNHVIT